MKKTISAIIALILISTALSPAWAVPIGNDVEFIPAPRSLGINIISPQAKLDVDGQVSIRGGSPATGKVLTSLDTSGLASWQTASVDNGSVTGLTANGMVFASRTGKLTNNPSNIFIDPITSNIGIGTTSPTEKLEVVGKVKANAFNGDGAAIKNISGFNIVGTIPGTVSPSSGTANALVIRNAGTDLNGQVSVVAGEVIMQDPSGASKKISSVNLLLNIATLGLNGLDSGVEAASKWYNIWIVGNSAGAVGGLFSTSLTSPVLPAGFTFKAYVGSIFNDSASKFIRIYQSGKTVIRTPTTKVKEGLLAGALASYSAASAIALTNGIPLNAVAVYADAGISEMSYLWSIQGAHFKPTLTSNIGETKLQNYYEATALYSDVKGESAWAIKMTLVEPQKVYYECFNTRNFCVNNDTGSTHTRVLFRTTGWELP